MEILVTGASGFLGGALASRLAARGASVRVLARSSSSLSHLDGLPLRVVRGALEDAASLRPALEGVGVVYHCAAKSADWGPLAEFEAANVVGTDNLLRASEAAGVRRFVHVSTTDVYGYPEQPGDESGPLVDTGLPYNRTKVAGEHKAWEAHQRGDLPVTVVRPATIYGPRSKDFVVEFARLLLEGGMVLLDSGRTHAGLLYVDNAVDAMIAAASTERAVGRAYNLRDEEDSTWRDYVLALAEGLGARPPWLDLPGGLALGVAGVMENAWGLFGARARPLLTRHAVRILTRSQGYDIAAAKRDLNFRSRVSFDEGVHRSLAWLESPEGRQALPRRG